MVMNPATAQEMMEASTIWGHQDEGSDSRIRISSYGIKLPEMLAVKEPAKGSHAMSGRVSCRTTCREGSEDVPIQLPLSSCSPSPMRRPKIRQVF
ncbi:hypothetical protein MLD38_035498 [Melastoma candidum]|uniref:Uncharacterized protein n=1 Tax=Melastoma candidum TaxID=119954 RepID=A0ACB9LGD3_9MYRT|nr:hypothetical protein MLD38_035498 [Melastoma candidum]